MHPSFFLRKRLAALVIVASFGSCNGLLAQITFTGLGPNAGSGYDVSDDGKVVIGGVSTTPYTEYRWTSATGAVSLEPAPGKIASNVSVSGDGNILTGTDYGAEPRVFRWSPSGGLQYLATPPGTQAAYGMGISGDGATIIGTINTGNGETPFRWTQASGLVLLGGGGGDDRGGISAVSQDGSVIAGTGVAGLNHAFRWTESTGRIALDDSDRSSMSRGMNSDGSIIVGAVFDTPTNQWEAFRWNEQEGMVGLANISGVRNAEAFKVSDDGSIILGGYDGGAFIWTPGSGMRDMLDVLNHDYGISSQTTGWTSLEPLGLSPDGRYIVGTGNLGAWLLDRGLDAPPIDEGQLPLPPPPLTPVPEPATYGIVASALLLGLAVRRQRTIRRAGDRVMPQMTR